MFIPTKAIRLASDKRLLAQVFIEHGVPTPETRLLDTFADVLQFLRQHLQAEWCLKYPTGWDFKPVLRYLHLILYDFWPYG